MHVHAAARMLDWRSHTEQEVRCVLRAQRGKLPLHWAAQFGDEHMLQRILATRPNLQAKDERGNSPLHLAAAAGHMCGKPPCRETCS